MATEPSLEETTDFRPRFDGSGLLPVIAQHEGTGEVLMLAYMNAEALRRTIETGEAHYWSRSRARIWRKGDTSGEVQHVVELRIDCDQDALLMTVRLKANGIACHTGRRSCFYRSVDGKTLRLAEVKD
ncbi:MAG: phosphoribosyl-AMP cyclohydrolase [Aestuariivirgaceae bacterium]